MIVASLLYSRKGTSARVYLSSKPVSISLDFNEIPDPDLSLQAAIKDGLKCYGKLYVHAAGDTVDTVCKRDKVFSTSEPLKNKVAFMLH